MDSLISVIVPVYKVEKYLDKCVKSLVMQTYENIEIVLVDDGSPDSCPKLCDRFAVEYEKVIALHKPNGGLGDARNYGVKHASGDYIVFVDSDDYVESTYVENLTNLLEKFNADISITRYKREDENGVPFSKKSVSFEDYVTTKEKAIFTTYVGDKVGWGACGKLFKKSVLLKHPFPKGLYEDAAVMYLILDECDIVAVGDYEGNYHYVTREGSILKSKLKKEHMHVFEVCDDFSKFIQKKYSNIGIIDVLFYRRAVTQMLNLQEMPKSVYKKIYCKYRKIFRSNIIKIIKCKDVAIPTKYYTFMLCLTPTIYRLQKRILSFLRKNK